MGWPFGLSKKKIAQVPPSQMGTGTPGDLSWIDVVKNRRAEAESIRKAEDARKAAQRSEELLRNRNKAMIEFASLIEARLPHGLKIVDKFFYSGSPIIMPPHIQSHLYWGQWVEHVWAQDNPVVRIDFGAGVRFDVMRLTQGRDPPGSIEGHLVTYAIYEPVSRYTEENLLACNTRIGYWENLHDVLYDALEKHNLKHSRSLPQ